MSYIFLSLNISGNEYYYIWKISFRFILNTISKEKRVFYKKNCL